MTSKFKKGDKVWVPTTRLADPGSFALANKSITRTEDNGRRLYFDDGTNEASVTSRLAHPSSLGFLLLKIGDFETESSLLDPLYKSILQYLRLLVPDDLIHGLEVRTGDEIRCFLSLNGVAYTHIIIVAHGRSDAILLPASQAISASDFGSLLSINAKRRVVISLACDTGKTAFGRAVSSTAGILDYVAPRKNVHGVSASLFVQRLLSLHLLEGREFETARRRASESVPGGGFVHWRQGKMNVTQARGPKKA